MSLAPSNDLNFLPDESKPVKQTQSSRAGGNGKIKTMVGYNDGSGDSGGTGEGGGGVEDAHPVPHQHLKDMAIVALEKSRSKNCEEVQALLMRSLTNQPVNAAEETANVLSALVVTAYSIGSAVPGGDAFSLLLSAFPNFTQKQLRKIADIAS